jgi:hypothetical protein
MITDEQLLTMPFAQQLVIVKLPAPTPGSAEKNPYIGKLKSTGHLAPTARQPARFPLISLRIVMGKALGQGSDASWQPVTLPATLMRGTSVPLQVVVCVVLQAGEMKRFQFEGSALHCGMTHGIMTCCATKRENVR